MCGGCEFPEGEPGAFRWTRESLETFNRWRLWRNHGGAGPKNFEEMSVFAEIDAIAAEIAGPCRPQRT